MFIYVPRPFVLLSGTDFDANPGGHLVDWGDVRAKATDRRLDLVVEHAFADLAGADAWPTPTHPTDAFAAAGTPVVPHTLRPRLPVGRPDDAAPGHGPSPPARCAPWPAARAVDDPTAEEQPGKILHEVRRAVEDPRAVCPAAAYYGTVDATPLWVGLLHDAWRWGHGHASCADLRRTSTRRWAGSREAADEPATAS